MESSVKVPKSFNNYKSEIFWGMGLFQLVNLVLFFGLILASAYLYFVGLYIVVFLCLIISVLPISLVLEYQGLSYFALLRRKIKAYLRLKKYYMENRDDTHILIKIEYPRRDYKSVVSILLILLILILVLIGVYSFAIYVFFS